MKHKNHKVKFSLKKRTISNLSTVELNSAKGGTEKTASGCTECIECYIRSINQCIATSGYQDCQTTTP